VLVAIDVIALQICDFGLSRMTPPDSSSLTLEVVTQYYRPPEILAGCSHYNSAIDVWSIGCIFAEMLGRAILFQSSSPIAQLDEITNLLGTPTPEELHCACPEARMYILKQNKKDQLNRLYSLSSHSTHEAVHLLCRFLVFDPKGRISCSDALSHPYLDEGRLNYHNSLCSCCHTRNRIRSYSKDLEPSSISLFDSLYEDSVMSVPRLREILWQFIHSLNPHKPPLYINPSAAVLTRFLQSTPGKAPVAS
jgi:nemo like kinase